MNFYDSISLYKNWYDVAILNLFTKSIFAISKDSSKIKLRDAGEAELKRETRILSSYVNITCYGNYDQINLIGFKAYSQEGYAGKVGFTIRQGANSV